MYQESTKAVSTIPGSSLPRGTFRCAAPPSRANIPSRAGDTDGQTRGLRGTMFRSQHDRVHPASTAAARTDRHFSTRLRPARYPGNPGWHRFAGAERVSEARGILVFVRMSPGSFDS